MIHFTFFLDNEYEIHVVKWGNSGFYSAFSYFFLKLNHFSKFFCEHLLEMTLFYKIPKREQSNYYN